MTDLSIEGIISNSIKDYITPKETIFKCKILITSFDEEGWLLSQEPEEEKISFIGSIEEIKYLSYDESCRSSHQNSYVYFQEDYKVGKFGKWIMDRYKQDGDVLIDGWEFGNKQYFIYQMERIC